MPSFCFCIAFPEAQEGSFETLNLNVSGFLLRNQGPIFAIGTPATTLRPKWGWGSAVEVCGGFACCEEQMFDEVCIPSCHLDVGIGKPRKIRTKHVFLFLNVFYMFIKVYIYIF